MLQISEERKKRRVPEEERGCSKGCETGEAKARECRVAIERERERERERGVIKRELVWFVESVVCKKDSHSLGDILSFAKWIGHRERERLLVSLSYAPCRVWQFTTTGHVAPVMGWPKTL